MVILPNLVCLLIFTILSLKGDLMYSSTLQIKNKEWPQDRLHTRDYYYTHYESTSWPVSLMRWGNFLKVDCTFYTLTWTWMSSMNRAALTLPTSSKVTWSYPSDRDFFATELTLFRNKLSLIMLLWEYDTKFYVGSFLHEDVNLKWTRLAIFLVSFQFCRMRHCKDVILHYKQFACIFHYALTFKNTYNITWL